NRQTAIANTPGVGQIFASASGLRGQPISIETCRVKSISIAAAGNPPSPTSFVVNTRTSTTLDATVTDIADLPMTRRPLTWSPSNPVSVGASAASTSTVYGGVGTASASAGGAGTV